MQNPFLQPCTHHISFLKFSCATVVVLKPTCQHGITASVDAIVSLSKWSTSKAQISVQPMQGRTHLPKQRAKPLQIFNDVVQRLTAFVRLVSVVHQ